MNKQEHKDTDRGALFAAANSGKGFVSFYDRVFDRPEIVRRYIIKGGPGTGKSSFMRQVAVCAEKKGSRVCYYRCSSDPDSLDGIVIDGTLVLLDGTAPHTVEPRLPGARDEIVNLGAFWDTEALRRHYDEIEAMDREKSIHYRKAYRYLSAAMEVEEINRALILPYLREEKMRGAVTRLLRSIPSGEGFDLLPGLQCAIGMRGQVRLDSYRQMATRVYSVEDFFGSASLLLRCVIEACREKDQPLSVSYDPLLPDRPDGVLLRACGLCFVVKRDEEACEDGVIRMRRFFDSKIPVEIKSEYRSNRRMAGAMLEGAEGALKEAGTAHSRLEAIYGTCMDFPKLEQFTRDFCRRVLGD